MNKRCSGVRCVQHLTPPAAAKGHSALLLDGRSGAIFAVCTWLRYGRKEASRSASVQCCSTRTNSYYKQASAPPCHAQASVLDDVQAVGPLVMAQPAACAQGL